MGPFSLTAKILFSVPKFVVNVLYPVTNFVIIVHNFVDIRADDVALGPSAGVRTVLRFPHPDGFFRHRH